MPTAASYTPRADAMLRNLTASPGSIPAAPPTPPSRPRGPFPPRVAARRWRRRGRRAQVAPVATILGLLLVVTFIATYLSTTLPNQMSINDLNHDILVENQVGQVGVVTDQLAAVGVVGSEASFPISLGSNSVPPFAGPDPAVVEPLTNWSQMYVNYSLSNPSRGTVAMSAATIPGAGFVVSVRNTYAPVADVAYDEGGIVFAQPGGVPTMVDPPEITLVHGALSIVAPVFSNRIGAEGGTTTAEIGVRLITVQTFTAPVTGYSLASGTPVVITVITPFAAAWLNYFDAQASFSGSTITCLPTSTGVHSVCSPSYEYVAGGLLGKVTISVPAPASLSVTQAFFAISVY